MNIRVQLDREENYNYFGVAKDTVVTMDIELYLRGVVPAEMGISSSWPDEALKVQAIAARTYAVNYIKKSAHLDFDVDDTVNYQAYRCSTIAARTNTIIANTAGLVLTYGGSIIDAVYSASNGGQTVSSLAHWGNYHPYLIAQPDPWTAASGYAKDGHGVGMSQRGAQYAGNIGKSYAQILNFYYPTTVIVSGYGSGGSGTGQSFEGTVQTGNSAPLNVRSQPSTSSTLLGTIANGTTVQVIDYNASWYQIDYNGQTAYIMKQYVQITGQGGGAGDTVIGVVQTGNSAPLNVRAQPSTSATLLGTVANGTTLHLLDYNATWYQFTFNGQTAFVMKQYIQVTGQGDGGYATWQDKYGNNTFVESYTYSGNVARYQADLSSWLVDHGYNGIAIDGMYGPNTIAATRTFQSNRGLGVDGFAGPITKAALFPLYN